MNINRIAGDAVAKVPVVNKSQIDEALIETSDRIGRFSSNKTTKTMAPFVVNQSSYVSPFIENIDSINRLYNQPMVLLFDKENIYLSQDAS